MTELARDFELKSPQEQLSTYIVYFASYVATCLAPVTYLGDVLELRNGMAQVIERSNFTLAEQRRVEERVRWTFRQDKFENLLKVYAKEIKQGRKRKRKG